MEGMDAARTPPEAKASSAASSQSSAVLDASLLAVLLTISIPTGIDYLP